MKKNSFLQKTISTKQQRNILVIFVVILSVVLVNLITFSPKKEIPKKDTVVSYMSSKTLPSKMKIQIFNDVNKTREALSQNGIGELRQWKGDAIGFLSITDYFDFGKSSYGLPNNIAYYLESNNENYVETAKLVLNINNNAETHIAMSKLKEVTALTFTSLFLEIPNGLLESISKQKEFSFENETFSTSLSLDKSKIETWRLVIESKQ